MPSKPVSQSSCPGTCNACHRSTLNGGTCPTWGEIEALRDDLEAMRAEYNIHSGDLTAAQIGAAMGVKKSAVKWELRRIRAIVMARVERGKGKRAVEVVVEESSFRPAA